MFVYISLFLISLFFYFYSNKLEFNLKLFFWVSFGFFLFIIIGLRNEIGVDWEAYKRHYEITINEKLTDILFSSDIAYSTLNWIIALFSGQVYTVNIICSFIFCYGLIKFCLKQQNPGIAIIVSLPILIIIVAMSYTRQSVAVGFELLALLAIKDGQNRKFIILIILAALFHKSAIILLTLIAFVSNKSKLVKVLSVFFFVLVIAFILFEQQYEALIELYYDQKLTSDGGLYRVILNIIPAFVILFFSKNSGLSKIELNLWVTLSIISLLLLPLISVTPTAIDRLYIYIIPLQIFTYSNLRFWFKNNFIVTIIEICVIIFYFLLMILWLNLSTYKEYWVPYRFFY